MIDFGGFYAQASWQLTGESRRCDRNKGTFAWLVPKRNFNYGFGRVSGRSPDGNLHVVQTRLEVDF